MNLVMILVFPENCSPRKTILYLERGETTAVLVTAGEVGAVVGVAVAAAAAAATGTVIGVIMLLAA
jgi:hypothetical protein